MWVYPSNKGSMILTQQLILLISFLAFSFAFFFFSSIFINGTKQILRKIFSGLIETEGEEPCHSICFQCWAHVPGALLWCSGSSWLTCLSAQCHIMSKLCSQSPPSSLVCPSSVAEQQAQQYLDGAPCIPYILLKLYYTKKISPSQSTCIRPKMII